MTEKTGQLAPDTVLEGRYVIVKVLGRGGMGAVYKALDQRLNNKPVAIKEVSSRGIDNLHAAVASIETSAKLISLRHTGFVVLFFAEREPGKRLYMMNQSIR
ncbi:MAG: serine/threonine-protein kinase [Bacillota bacterium]